MNRVFGTVSAIALLWQLVKPFEQWEAFRLGIVDAHGKLLRSPQTPQERNAYDPLTRVALNLERLLEKVPFGSSQLASVLSAYLLWREDTDQEFVEQQPTKNPNPIKEYLANRKRISNQCKCNLEELSKCQSSRKISRRHFERRAARNHKRDGASGHRQENPEGAQTATGRLDGTRGLS